MTEAVMIDIPEWFLLGGYDRVPPGWKRHATFGVPTRFIELGDPSTRLQVIITGATEKDGKRWLHVSLSRPHQIPDYADMCLVKSVFIGENKKAIQVFAPIDEHVNIMSTCLHLWSCLDGDGLPDFRTAGQL
jgi:hypothetical protein